MQVKANAAAKKFHEEVMRNVSICSHLHMNEHHTHSNAIMKITLSTFQSRENLAAQAERERLEREYREAAAAGSKKRKPARRPSNAAAEDSGSEDEVRLFLPIPCTRPVRKSTVCQPRGRAHSTQF